jgi:hypothetical protein
MAAQPSSSPEQVSVPTIWIEDSNVPVFFANAFAVQPVQNEFILTFATAIPPVITKPLTREEAEKLQIRIKPTVRIGVTPDRALELIQLLQKQLSVYTQATTRN